MSNFRMTKATISLIPLLGIQTGILPFFQEKYGFSKEFVDFILPINILFAASQGFIVSILYCFTSHEVREAVMRKWYMHKEVMRINKEIISRRQSRDLQAPFLANFKRSKSFTFPRISRNVASNIIIFGI